MQKNTFAENVKILGVAEIFEPFKPSAYYVPQLRLIMVATKDCSYTAERISKWSDVHWENHRPWYAPWKRCVGFSVYCPPPLRFPEDTSVSAVLESVELMDPRAFGKYRNMFYRLGKYLTVSVPA